MEQEIDTFIRFLAVERGLSENYQLSTAALARRIRRPGAPQRKQIIAAAPRSACR